MTEDFLSNNFYLDLRKMSNVDLVNQKEEIINSYKDLNATKDVKFNSDRLKLDAIKEEIDRRFEPKE